MFSFPSKKAVTLTLSVCIVFLFFNLSAKSQTNLPLLIPSSWLPHSLEPWSDHAVGDGKFYWSKVPTQYPVKKITKLPPGKPKKIPKIQHDFPDEDARSRKVRLQRQAAVKENFVHAWQGYRLKAWLRDELKPISGGGRSSFGGWAATLVDALDTLWIMGLKDEFAFAVNALNEIDFTKTSEQKLNTFETNIRYLGGLLSAYDISEGKYPVLLRKASELGQMLYLAFDTPNRMPMTRWYWKAATQGKPQRADDIALLAEIGSFSLEFTRLSQITGDPRYYDAIQRITDEFEKQQQSTKLPGMFPVIINARKLKFGQDTGHTLGAMADSFYEYLPKEYLLLGGLNDAYRRIYERAADVFTKHNFYRPMTKEGSDVLLSGLARTDSDGNISLDASCQHLVCYAGGMVGLAAKIFNRTNDLETARKLTNGCVWAYKSMPNGIMAETAHLVPCKSVEGCPWDQKKWFKAVRSAYKMTTMPTSKSGSFSKDVEDKIKQERIPPGYASVDDHRYILRPEAIESVFILYRITGDRSLQDDAWDMFNAIVNHTRTPIAHAALDDVTVTNPPKADSMESFWLAETLKYFYLIFSKPNVVSLDDFVFNTEAHPLRRPK